MQIHFVSGISGDRVEITPEGGKMQSFAYGYNASYSRDWADSKKPYIGDIIKEFAAKEDVNLSEVPVTGYYVFPQREATQKEIDEFRNRYMTT